jgi:monooxygenase
MAGGMSNEHFDVLIVGAGISGIGAGYHLQDKCPKRTYAILEGRSNIGGTWDLFKYPGIRSDSDMYTLGFAFRPWKESKAIANAPAIMKYLGETASDYGIDKKIRFNHQVKAARWDSKTARWTVVVERGLDKETAELTCNFLFMCSGYYNYAGGYSPDFPGQDDFQGRIVHPQKWTYDIEYADKKVVVIGSGATAVTLVPEMAKTAAHVTMLQRSPTYVASRPAEDAFANWLRKVLPAKLAYTVTRWKNVLMQMYFFKICRDTPEKAKELIMGQVREALGEDYVKKHFTPRYNPWDQRLCLVPDGDLFEAIKADKASVVTDHIEKFDATGITLKSGDHLDADLIVTATGLNLQFLSGVAYTVDGTSFDPANAMNYKGMMYSGLPNLASSFGYTNASWTLKADLTCEYVCRLLNHMEARGYAKCTPRLTDPSIEKEPWLDFSSGYVTRTIDQFPKQGSKAPWKVHQNYALDIMNFRFSKLEDGTMEFARAG